MCEEPEGHYTQDETDDRVSPHRCTRGHDYPFVWWNTANGAYYEPDPSALKIEPTSTETLAKRHMLQRIEQLEIENDYLRRLAASLAERSIIIVNNQGGVS